MKRTCVSAQEQTLQPLLRIFLSLVLVIPKLWAQATLVESYTADGCRFLSGQGPRSAVTSVAMGSWAVLQNCAGCRRWASAHICVTTRKCSHWTQVIMLI